jgi:hypothetical protein
MGSSITPQYQRQVSVTPPDYSMASPVGPVVSSFQAPPTEQVPNFTGRVLYPSSTYHSGDPGYYYDDPLQFPVSIETQLSPPHDSYTGTHVPLSPPVQPQGQNVLGADSTQVPFFPSLIDLLPPLGDDNASMNNHFIPSSINNNPEHRSVPHPTVHNVGCQVSPLPLAPVTVYKEAKKLSLPSFDPTKMSWTSFAMKLHASLIECDYMSHTPIILMPHTPRKLCLNSSGNDKGMLSVFLPA